MENLSDPGESLSQREGGDSESFSSDSEDQHSQSSGSESGSEDSQDEQYDGGLGDLGRFEEYRLAKGLKDLIEVPEGSGKYFQKKTIGDKGFKRWMTTYEGTYSVIKWISLFITFRFWRMTYSYFMRQKQFLIIYQKKKFKKFIISTTMIGMILVELPNLIGAVLGFSSL